MKRTESSENQEGGADDERVRLGECVREFDRTLILKNFVFTVFY